MNRGFFGTWELWRKIALGGLVALAATLFATLYLPLGMVVLGLMIVSPYIWRPVGHMADPRLGMYTPNTKPYALAMFMMSLKYQLKTVLNLIVMVGMGPPAADPAHGVEPGFFPFTRLSSYWAAFLALLLGIFDILLAPAHAPFWGKENFEPWWIFSYVISVVGWYATIQIMCAVFRIRGGWRAQAMAAVEPMPAVMIDKVKGEILSRETIKKSVIYGSIPAAIIVIVWLSVKWPWYWTLLGAFIALSMTALISASRTAQKHYIQDWEYQNERREFWQNAFSFMRDEQVPTLAGTEYELPTYEEWEAHNDPDDEDTEPYRPLVKIATFGYPTGTNYETFAKSAGNLSSQLDVEACAIEPVGIINSSGEEQTGTVGAKGFRVWFTEEDLPDPLDPNLDQWLRNFAVRALVVPRFADIKNIGRCVFQECKMVTQPSSKHQILEVKLVPPVGVNVTSFLDNIQAIQNVLDVPWVRADRDADSKASTVVLYIGQEPAAEGMRYYSPPQKVTKKIAKMNWLYTFNAQKLIGTTGAPELLSKFQATKVVDKLTFRLPDGLSFERIASQISSLRTTSGNSFMEINLGDDSDTSKMTPMDRARAEQDQSSKFTVIASKRDPLDRVFEFGKYYKELMPGREKGVAKIDWSPGVLADDTLGKDSWMNSDAPHLLVAGASGSGKQMHPDTPILTSKGFKKLKYITVGDIVFDLHGNPTKVTNVGATYVPKSAYEVTFSDGSKLQVSGDHQWLVEDSESRRRMIRGRILSDYVVGATTTDAIEIRRRLTLAADAMEIDSPAERISDRSEDAEGIWVAHDDNAGWRPAGWWAPYAEAINKGQRQYQSEYAAAVAAISPEAWGALLIHGNPAGGSLSLTGMQTSEAVAALVQQTSTGINAVPTISGVDLHMHRRILGRAVEGVNDSSELLSRVMEVHGDSLPQVLIGMLVGGLVEEQDDKSIALIPSEKVALLAAVSEHVGAELELARGEGIPEGMAVVSIDTTAMNGIDLSIPLDAGAFISGAHFFNGGSGELISTGHSNMADELLARGVMTRSEDEGVSLRVADTKLLSERTLEDFVRDTHLGWSFVGGWSASCGILLENGYIELVAKGAAEKATVIMAIFDSIGVPAQIEMREDDLVISAYLPGNFVRMTQSGDEMRDLIRHEKRYNSNGQRVLTLTELHEATGISPLLIEQTIEGENIPVSGRWENPTLERDEDNGWMLGLHPVESLYVATTVLRALANSLGANESGDDSMMVMTTDEMLNGMVHGDVRYSVPHHRINESDLAGIRTPVPQHESAMERRYVESITPIDPVPMLCISVDSPTKTYRAGHGLVPTHNSVVMSSMILQILFNNGPTEARFWMVEPKNEMQIYRDCDLVERFVDSWTPDNNFIANAADLMEDAVKEMDRRNEMFVNHPKSPKNLAKAREIAIRESEDSGQPLERNPLYMPFMFIILEECASLFADSASKEEKMEQTRLVVATAEIARKSRSAGIYLICATQYPTNASIPSVIRNQMRRIGMRCQNDLASRVVIEENGLEQVRVKGAGKIKSGDSYRNFRGYWVRDDDPDKPGAVNDIFDVIGKIPKNNGATNPTGATMGGPAHQRVVVPNIAATVFNRFDKSQAGRKLSLDVDSGKSTPDIEDSDVPTRDSPVPV